MQTFSSTYDFMQYNTIKELALTVYCLFLFSVLACAVGAYETHTFNAGLCDLIRIEWIKNNIFKVLKFMVTTYEYYDAF